ncbi:hypothetical protein BJX99DRAFT_229736 [Aspergillus californicus]
MRFTHVPALLVATPTAITMPRESCPRLTDGKISSITDSDLSEISRHVEGSETTSYSTIVNKCLSTVTRYASKFTYQDIFYQSNT